VHFGAGEREEAKEHFERSVETRVFCSPAYQIAQAILERMRQDSGWPDWIPAKRESE
jgi:hypothetical protein